MLKLKVHVVLICKLSRFFSADGLLHFKNKYVKVVELKTLLFWNKKQKWNADFLLFSLFAKSRCFYEKIVIFFFFFN